ncbi:SDR family NAD(P)-dependent oxidoreductase [Agrobacterium vitis]|nr:MULTISPECIES: SDR family NAD(P)-dependent oxidoreductase [Rhizobium/Agrobacterium group]MCF1435821.1 SDR family NAD(P)-dependent oxidoreductase [Allorhizobium ampelinum]MCF1462462.1 SDR family NAD(P)-dependent oxidoreductase [Allorhizobium ampelinum]MUO90418.1 SDR family NAD(P)-dependent oxidoreductase [Agrobacterium vitis]MUZ52429.1 SDR family NAD(P)-dependent oxidoreductase [Agrobacterium vitis]MUZ91521.1 SDR family NAD(P)-dependent oxidoreductase [Agrobacterium vitis]
MVMSSSPRARVAWITGASSGIGRSFALKLAREGYIVGVSARRTEDLMALAAENPDRIHAFPLDITDGNAVKQVVGDIEAKLGPIDMAVFSAGSYIRETAERFDAEQLRRMVDLNLVGTGHCLEAVIAVMVARGKGRIGLVGSVSGYSGLPGGGIYGATKSAMITLAEALRPGLLEKGVVISIINPGFVKTPLTDKNDFPMPFLVTAEQAADHIEKGMEAGKFEIAFPWQMVLSLKLLRLLPYPLYFALTRKMLRKT